MGKYGDRFSTLALLSALAGTACSAAPTDDVGVSRAEINKGIEDRVITGIGYLRPVGTENEACSLTLIEPTVALTAAHCFWRAANQCETTADAARKNEVVFSPRGDDTDRFVFGIDAVAIAPDAYLPTLGACGGKVGGYSCDGAEPNPQSGNDMALIKLSKAVPESVAHPLPVITSELNSISSAHGVHALLDSPSGPVLSGVDAPYCLIGGWGISKNCGDRRRRIGLMDLTGWPIPARWHQGCRRPQLCDASYSEPDSSTCEAPAAFAPDWNTDSNAVTYDMIRLARTSSKADPVTFKPIYDGPIVNSGDSGGPLLMWLRIEPAFYYTFFLVGAVSAGTNEAKCNQDPPDQYLTADYSVTFSAHSGPWIERTIAAWSTVSPPPPRCRFGHCPKF